MDKYRDCHTERSKSDKDKCYMISLIWEILKKNRYKQIYLQNRNRVINVENKLMTLPGLRG